MNKPSLPQALGYMFILIPWLYIMMLMITSSQYQTTLDGTFPTQQYIAPFSKWGLINHLVKLVVTEDEAFQLLDKPMFQCLLYYLHPTLPKGGIPHCTKIHDKMLACTVQAKAKVKAILQVCLTFACHDLWEVLTILQGGWGGNLLYIWHLEFWGWQHHQLLITYSTLYW